MQNLKSTYFKFVQVQSQQKRELLLGGVESPETCEAKTRAGDYMRKEGGIFIEHSGNLRNIHHGPPQKNRHQGFLVHGPRGPVYWIRGHSPHCPAPLPILYVTICH